MRCTSARSWRKTSAPPLSRDIITQSSFPVHAYVRACACACARPLARSPACPPGARRSSSRSSEETSQHMPSSVVYNTKRHHRRAPECTGNPFAQPHLRASPVPTWLVENLLEGLIEASESGSPPPGEGCSGQGYKLRNYLKDGADAEPTGVLRRRGLATIVLYSTLWSRPGLRGVCTHTSSKLARCQCAG